MSQPKKIFELSKSDPQGIDWPRLTKLSTDLHICKSPRSLFRVFRNFLSEYFGNSSFQVYRIERGLEHTTFVEAFSGIGLLKDKLDHSTPFLLRLLKDSHSLTVGKSYSIGRAEVSFGLVEGESEWLWQSSLLLEHPALDFAYTLFMQKQESLHKIDSAQALLYRDELSGLYNYRYLRVALLSETRRADRLKTVFSLLFVDVDDLKKINDAHGHLFGSFVLRQCGQLLKDELRDIDTVIRYGGDEFVVILLGVDPKQACIVAERIRARIAQHVFASGPKTSHVTVSIGISSYPNDGKQIDDLVHLADKAMFDSKRSGKNQVQAINS